MDEIGELCGLMMGAIGEWMRIEDNRSAIYEKQESIR
jgi:hypothetical protein